MKHNIILITAAFIFFMGIVFTSCKNDTISSEIKSEQNEADLLIEYLEQNGNYINSGAVPSNIDAVSLYGSITKNILIIDIRDAASYSEGHIKGAFNIEPDSLLSFFENVIEPVGFDSIVFVCDIGMRSAFVASVFRMLGYNNVFSLKFGMSSWNSRYADALWMANLSSHLESELETETHSIPEKNYYPVIQTGQTTPYLILRERARTVLADSLKKYFIGVDDVAKDYSKYFIIKYWPESLNHIGQLKGAYRFMPKASLSSKTLLFKIPVDKPILLYCYSGTHGSFAVAFLRILGYDAYSLRYGTNAFMYNTILKNTPDHAFGKQHVNDFPIETAGPTVIQQQMDAPAIKVKGGC